MKYFKKILFTLTLGLITFGGAFVFGGHQNVNATSNMNPAYDLSEWQHQISDSQAQQLKNESSFVILRAQYGGNYPDKTFSQNAAMMEKYGIPYGAYSYSLYANDAQAKEEAQNLYHRAPNARFYANDLEQSNMNQNDLNNATVTWSNTIKSLSNKPTILYSGQYFMKGKINDNTRNAYDAVWLANYSKYEPNPNYHYDLWQFTSSYHSNALGQSVDASIIPDGGKPLSFWTGNSNNSNTNTNDNNSNANDLFPSAPTDSNDQGNNYQNGDNDQNNQGNNYQNNDNNQNNQSNNGQNNNNQNDQMSFPSAPSNDDNTSDNTTNNQTPTKHKSKINHHLYYVSKKVTQLRVKSRGGINIYTDNGHKIGHVKHGAVISVDHFRHFKTMTKAVTPNGHEFSANKKLVKWAR